MAKKEISYDNALSRCATLCARAEHSRFELMRKMRQWGANGTVIEKVIETLEDGGFIDEERFAHAFVNDKYRFDGWGRIKIRYSLRQQGIADNLIAEAMNEIDGEEYEEILSRLLKAKHRMVAGRDPYKQKDALVRYAASRGFELSLVSRMVASLVAGADDFEVDDVETDV